MPVSTRQHGLLTSVMCKSLIYFVDYVRKTIHLRGAVDLGLLMYRQYDFVRFALAIEVALCCSMRNAHCSSRVPQAGIFRVFLPAFVKKYRGFICMCDDHMLWQSDATTQETADNDVKTLLGTTSKALRTARLSYCSAGKCWSATVNKPEDVVVNMTDRAVLGATIICRAIRIQLRGLTLKLIVSYCGL